jgi:hypothetical protein
MSWSPTSFHALARSGLTSRLTFVITEGRWAEEHATATTADTHTRVVRIRVPYRSRGIYSIFSVNCWIRSVHPTSFAVGVTSRKHDEGMR